MISTVLERNLLPDWLIRAGIRGVVAGRLREQEAGGVDAQSARFEALRQWLPTAPIADSPASANAQHYELPASFFGHVLGPHLKYSCSCWLPGVSSLAEAEAATLALTADRAGCGDGQRILELGCGWGSLTLHLAAAYPRSEIVAVSNSSTQRHYIMTKAGRLGLTNVSVVTSDINVFEPDGGFDRIVSVEMLEHVRNYPRLFARIARWLRDDGRFFAHVFAHRRFAYPFESRGRTDWMARHFFTGGMMPSDDLFLHLQDDLVVDGHWRLGGRHYQRTAEAWLQNFDRNRAAIEPLLASVYGADGVTRWRVRWRVFFMACAEMFGYRSGQEWIVAHYRFRKRAC
jgi:cyclopropane-fatty-acyl-phospholipid synthase